MITNGILILFSTVYNFLISLIPKLSFLDSVISAKDKFIEFISPFISYSLYFFNITVLKIAMSILVVYFLWVFSEYLIKLFVKYVLDVI